MAQYSKDSPSKCQQCDGHADAKYHENESRGHPLNRAFEIFSPTCDHTPGAVKGRPHMHRTCQTCGYEWAEEPLV